MLKNTILTRVVLVALSLLTFTGTSFAGSGVKKPTIAAIVIITDQEFFKIVQAGYRDAARSFGVNLLQSSSDLKLATQMRLIDNYIAMGVDALIISPYHQKRSAAAIQRAQDQGIRTIITCIPLEAGSPPDTTIASSDSQLGFIIGKTAKNYIDKKAGKRVKIAILAFDDRQPVQSGLRVKGFSDEVTKAPGVSIVTRQNAWAPAMAIKVAGDIISETPDLDIIFSANEGGTIGAVLAVKLAGKADTIKVFGVDSSQQITEMLLSEDNILQAVAVQRPYEIAREAMDLAMKALKGEAIPETVHVPGFVLNRKRPGEIKDYRKYLKQILR